MFPDLTRDDVFRLETRRLWLRWPRRADATGIARLAGEKAVAEMTTRVPHPYEPAQADAFVREARSANMQGRRLTMVITPRSAPDRPIGVVGISWDDPGQPFIGYWLGAPSWGSGYATEAARALIDAFFAYADGTALTASARVINPASRRVLEKCGFSVVGSGLQAFPARGGLLPVDHFLLDRRAWESIKSWSTTGFVPQVRHEDHAFAH